MRQIKLQESSYGKEEILEVMDSLLSTNVTMGEKTQIFERKFSLKYNSDSPFYIIALNTEFKPIFSTFVNSGSSANLLLINLLTSRLGKYKLQPNDEILVPSVTWVTSITPIIQMGLIPVICDVYIDSFNISLDSCKRMLTDKTRALFYVPLLGNTTGFDKVLEFCEENNLLLIIDACEATGAKYNGKNICEYGVGSTYSLYYGHHISAVEGGTVVTRDEEDDNIIKMLRSHGWARNLPTTKQQQLAEKHGYESIEEMMFTFFDIGWNLRPTDLNASFAIHQLDRIDEFIKKRRENWYEYSMRFNTFITNGDIEEQDLVSDIMPFNTEEKTKEYSSPFAYGFYLNPDKYTKKDRNNLIKYLKENGVESRQIVGGNLARNPVFEIYADKVKVDTNLTNADILHELGIYLPLHQGIKKGDITYITELVGKFF